MRHARLFTVRYLWVVAALLGGLFLVGGIVGAAQALSARPIELSTAPGGIQGVLYDPAGTTPVVGGWIDIHDAEGQPWMGTATATGGSFSIANLPPGEYILNAHPPPESDHAASLPEVVEVLSGQWATKNLYLTEVRISGWVQDSGTGARIEGAQIVAHDEAWTVERWATTHTNGEFKIGGLAIGVTYTLEAFPPPESAYVPLSIPYTAVPVATDVVLEMYIPPTNVIGTVHNPEGDPVPGAGVVVWHEEFWRETAADELGDFLFRGLPPGEFLLQAAPPWGEHGEGLLSSPPLAIAIPQPDTLVNVGVITLPHAVKWVSGEVLYAETGGKVSDAVVVAHRLDQPGFVDQRVAPNGVFTLYLPGGEWHLEVAPPPPPTPPPEWIYPGPPAWVPFIKPVSETEEIPGVILEVIPTNAWIEGQVLCPGSPDPVSCAGDPPPEAIWVELRREELGNGVGLGPDYRFLAPVPDGWYELVVHAKHPELQGPEPVPVFVGPGQTLDVGGIALLLKDARITGQVRSEFGDSVSGASLVGWQPDGFGWGWAETDANGFYTMPVIGGEWFVTPQPGPEMPLVLRQRPQLVRVVPGGMVVGVDFVLTVAESRIEGSAVDANSGERLLGMDGWTTAHLFPGKEFFSNAPMRDGGFELKARGGETYVVGVDMPPHAPYVSGGSGPVYIPPASYVPISVPLEHKNATIEGALVIAGTQPPEPALGVWAEVFGEDEQGHWVVAGVDPGSAGYALGVISGTWHLRARVDPGSGYVAVPTVTTVILQSHQGVPFVDFEVWPINALISGTVRAPDGSPLPGAFVFAEGESPFVGYFESHAESNESGHYELSVPEGGYMVGAALPGDELGARGWLNPQPIDVPWVAAASPAVGQDLRFRRLDGEIRGTVTFAPGIVVTPTHPAYVWGWTDAGEWAESEAVVVAGTDTLTYAMRVVSSTIWHIGAVYEDWNSGVFYESAEETVNVLPPAGQAVQDLELSGPWSLPQPIIVSFDGTYMQTIQLLVPPDRYLEIVIPPGSLVVSGTVTLFIFPTQELRPEPGQEIIGAGYQIWAVDQNGQEITQFNQNVILKFPYPLDEVLAAQGISEQLLVPVYYSTLVGQWILADSYVVDIENNEITLQVRHFTKFGVLSTEGKGHQVYLPALLKGFQP